MENNSIVMLTHFAPSLKTITCVYIYLIKQRKTTYS